MLLGNTIHPVTVSLIQTPSHAQIPKLGLKDTNVSLQLEVADIAQGIDSSTAKYFDLAEQG